MPTDDDLLDRWEATLPHQRELGADLLGRYRQPHRRYHTVEHLAAVLQAVDDFATGDEDLFLVRLAVWFHDAIYDIPERELINEEASARLSIRALSRAGLEQEDLTQVARLVRLTETHLPGTRDPEGELLCDADLAILAAEPAAYERYVRQVREEYAAVPDEVFEPARRAVLGRLAEGDIFRTPQGRRLMDRARANVTAEIAELDRRLGTAVEGSGS